MGSAEIILSPVDQLLAAFESDDFYCDVAIASSPTSFYRRLARHPLTLQLRCLVESNPENALRVLKYASMLARSVQGRVRSEKDAALCACLVALRNTAFPGFDDLLRFLRSSKELALRWAADVAEIVSAGYAATVFTEMGTREQRGETLTRFFDEVGTTANTCSSRPEESEPAFVTVS